MVRLRSFGKRIIGVVTPALLAIFVLCQIVVAFRFIMDSERTDGYGYFFEKNDITDDNVTVQTGSGNDFSDGKGIILISCGKFSGGGSVNIYVNGCIEATLKPGDSKTLRVSVGDVVLAMGYKLTSPVDVRLETAVGRFDCSIANKVYPVGNKGRLIAVIKKSDM